MTICHLSEVQLMDQPSFGISPSTSFCPPQLSGLWLPQAQHGGERGGRFLFGLRSLVTAKDAGEGVRFLL